MLLFALCPLKRAMGKIFFCITKEKNIPYIGKNKFNLKIFKNKKPDVSEMHRKRPLAAEITPKK
jgi:hypothetical protein